MKIQIPSKQRAKLGWNPQSLNQWPKGQHEIRVPIPKNEWSDDWVISPFTSLKVSSFLSLTKLKEVSGKLVDS